MNRATLPPTLSAVQPSNFRGALAVAHISPSKMQSPAPGWLPLEHHVDEQKDCTEADPQLCG
ncbi:hypothetical protein GCM10009651_12040 [Microbacterium natoriense]